MPTVPFMPQAASRGHLHCRRRRPGRSARQRTHTGGHAARRRPELRLQRCVAPEIRLLTVSCPTWARTSTCRPCAQTSGPSARCCWSRFCREAQCTRCLADAGILRGCGRQSWGAYLNLACFWALGLPLCWFLGLHLGLGLLGLWGGIAAATAVQACALLQYLALPPAVYVPQHLCLVMMRRSACVCVSCATLPSVFVPDPRKAFTSGQLLSASQGCIFGWICWTLDWREESERAAVAVKQARGAEADDSPDAAPGDDVP